MLLILKSTAEELGQEAARIVANAIRRNPRIRLGLATGSTTVGMYKELVRLHREESLDFSGVITFNLDEYLGLSATHPQSFHYFMRENFFAYVDIPESSIHIPDGGIRGQYDKYCAGYEQAIRDAGGVDLQILGIGRNGHIGFNEPTSSLGSRTRLKVLTKETIEDNRRFFAPGRGDSTMRDHHGHRDDSGSQTDLAACERFIEGKTNRAGHRGPGYGFGHRVGAAASSRRDIYCRPGGRRPAQAA